MFGKDNIFKINTNNTSNTTKIFANIGQSQSLFPANPPIQTSFNLPSNTIPNLGAQNKEQKEKLNIFGVHQQKKIVEQNNKNKMKQVQQNSNPFNFFKQPIVTQTQKISSMDSKTNLTHKEESSSNKLFGDTTPPYFSFNTNKNELNMQTIQKQSQSVEKKLFGELPNKIAQSSVLSATTQKKEEVAVEGTKFFSKAPTQNNFFNKETIKNSGQYNPPKKDQKQIVSSRRKEQQKLYGLTLKQIQKLTEEIERDIQNRRGQIEYIQSIKESLLQEKMEKKQKIIGELRKQKNNVILNNNNTLQIQIFTKRVQQQENENEKMREEKKQILEQIGMLDNQIKEIKQKKKEIIRHDFPTIEPSVSVQQILSKICQFLPSNKIRDQDIKLKETIQKKANIEQQIKQGQQITKELEIELKKKQEQFRASQNQIINILEDEQELKDYLNNKLKPERIQLEKEYQRLKKQVKYIKANKRNSREMKIFQGFSQIY